MPFALLFDMTDAESRRNNFFLIILQIPRLFNVEHLISLTDYEYFRIHYAMTTIINSVLLYALLNHFCTCLLIFVSRITNNLTYAWFDGLAGSFDSIGDQYIYIWTAQYSYAATHAVAIRYSGYLSFIEKGMNALIGITGFFAVTYIFANVAIVYDDLTPKVRQNFQRNYRVVKKILKKIRIEVYLKKAEEYYSYIWGADKGLLENDLFEQIPSGIKTEVILGKYKDLLVSCPYFLDENMEPNWPVISAFFRLCTFSVYLKDDFLIYKEEYNSPIFLIIEGEIVQKEKKSITKISAGNLIGSLIPNTHYPCNVLSNQATKVAIITHDDYITICHAFPTWADLIRQIEQRKNKAYIERNEVMSLHDGGAGLGFAAQILSLTKLKQTSIDELMGDDFKVPTRRRRCNSAEILGRELKQKRPRSPSRARLYHMVSFDDFKYADTSPSNKFARRERNKRESRAPTFMKRQFSLGGKKKNHNKVPISVFSRADLLNQLRLVSYQEAREAFEIKRDARFYLMPSSLIKITADIIHMTLIIYGMMFQPIRVAFGLPMTDFFITMEIICFIEAVIYIAIQFRTATDVMGMWTVNFKIVCIKFIQNGLIFQLIALVPFNLIFMDESEFNLPLSILLIHKTIMYGRFTTLLNSLEDKYQEFSRLTLYLKVLFHIMMLLNWSACLWYYYLTHSGNDVNPFNLLQPEIDEYGIVYQYFSMLKFVMNFYGCASYPEDNYISDYSRIMTIIFIYLGTAIYALGFGVFASMSTVIPLKFAEYYDLIYKVNMIVSEMNIPPLIRKKLILFYEHAVNNNSDKTTAVTSLNGLLPAHLVEEMGVIQIKSVFDNFDLFRTLKDSPFFMKQIYPDLERVIYFPFDYVIHRDEFGDEMFFVVQGTVSALTVNEKSVLQWYPPGTHFGENALFSKARRPSAVIAEGFVHLIIIRRSTLEKIMKNFPELQDLFEVQEHVESARKKKQGDGHKKVRIHTGAISSRIFGSDKSSPRGGVTTKLMSKYKQKKSLFTRPGLVTHTNNITQNMVLPSDRPFAMNYDELLAMPEEIIENEEDIPPETLVEPGELMSVEEEGDDKISLRHLPKVMKRRYSRTRTTTDKMSSKTSGVCIKWGISMD